MLSINLKCHLAPILSKHTQHQLHHTMHSIHCSAVSRLQRSRLLIMKYYFRSKRSLNKIQIKFEFRKKNEILEFNIPTLQCHILNHSHLQIPLSSCTTHIPFTTVTISIPGCTKIYFFREKAMQLISQHFQDM